MFFEGIYEKAFLKYEVRALTALPLHFTGREGRQDLEKFLRKLHEPDSEMMSSQPHLHSHFTLGEKSLGGVQILKEI